MLDKLEQYKQQSDFHKQPVLPQGAQPSLGWMKGVLAAKDLQKQQNEDVRAQGMLGLAENADIRAEKELEMKQEAFSWQREDRQNEQFIQQGMAEAFQQGGYSGVIDFLQSNKPDMALQFTNAKLDLDQKMMKTDVMKAALPTQKAAILAEGYKIMGQMGAGLLRAPEQDREGMYQQMLPIIKKVNPDAPSTLDQGAVDMLTLAVAQSMPANIIYASKQDSLSAQSKMGKLDVDIRSRIAAGETVDNSESLRAMVDAYKNESTKAQLAQERLDNISFQNSYQEAQRAKSMVQANAAQYTLTSNMNSRLQAESKNYLTMLDQKNTFDGAMKAISSGGGGAAQTAAYRQVAMMFNKGALSDPDVAAFANSDNVIQVARKKLESVNSEGGLKALNPTEIQRLQVLMDEVFSKAQDKQNVINNRYRTMAKKFGVNPNDLSIYDPVDTSVEGAAQMANEPNYSDADIAYTAKLKGMTPDQVRQLLQQKQSGSNQ